MSAIAAPAVVDAELWTKVRQRFTRYYESESGLWRQSRFLGVPIEKFPTDLWVYQELISRVRPDVLIETGTLAGGSALYFATIMDAIGHGEVISIDIEGWPRARFEEWMGDTPRPDHPRIQYITADSLEFGERYEATALANRWIYETTGPSWDRRSVSHLPVVMVVLDSDHSYAHVLKELDLYAPLVTPGSYLVVEDTGMSERTNPGKGSQFGAAEALAEWLPKHPEFEVDRDCERFLFTTNPGGWLRRKE